MTKKGKPIFQTADPFGATVICTDTTWRHIEKGHKEMVGKVADVKAAIEKPDVILSTTYPWEAYRFQSGTGTSSEIRVIVDYQQGHLFDTGATAYVSTAFTPDPAYNSPHIGAQVWPKQTPAVDNATDSKSDEKGEGGA